MNTINIRTMMTEAAEKSVVEANASATPTRRQALRLGLAAGFAASASGLLLPKRPAFADTPKRGGSITVAGGDSSPADTLDPARSAYGTDYVRLFMF